MSTKLLSLELGSHSLQDNEDKILKNIEQEIECLPISDIMKLSSDFDRFLYFCQECHLSLLMNIAIDIEKRKERR
jgi:hypothetical protein